jgi:hypothetical protein
MRTIDNAYDAWHFLRDHPSFKLRERHEIPPEDYDMLLARGFLVSKDRGGKCWREMRHLYRRAVDMNLTIGYMKVDATGYVNDVRSMNIVVDVWLEFGPESYDYDGEGFDETTLQNGHDWELDCGGPTFDEALVKLANKVLAKYGDYVEKSRSEDCGPVPCADCVKAQRECSCLGI